MVSLSERASKRVLSNHYASKQPSQIHDTANAFFFRFLFMNHAPESVSEFQLCPKTMSTLAPTAAAGAGICPLQCKGTSQFI